MKALSAEDREVLSEPFANNSITNATARHSAGLRALALIDAQAALLAEYAAQAVVDGQRIAELERDNAAIDASHRFVLNQRNDAQDRAEAAEARIAELERERDETADRSNDVLMALEAVESKLAAANALLREWRAAKVTDEWIDSFCERVDVHLANQPAAPARTEAEHWTDKRNSHWVRPAAPARTEGEQALRECRDLLRQLSPRVVTEAEQAVLDACTACPEGVLVYWAKDGAHREAIANAELARRGLK
jgi:hypothetical protein